MAVISLNSSHVGEYPQLGWRATKARPIAHISAHEASRGSGTTLRDVVRMAGSCRRSLSKVSAWCCPICSQSACCRRGQEGARSLESSQLGALSPAWCTPDDSASGPIAGLRPGSAEVVRARMSAQCVIKLHALEVVGVLDTNASKRRLPMSNALSPKRRPRRGKEPWRTTSPSPSTRSVNDSQAWMKHPAHAGAKRLV